jgi:hypothetical protein
MVLIFNLHSVKVLVFLKKDPTLQKRIIANETIIKLLH